MNYQSQFIQEKCWGTCHHLFVSPHAAVSLLQLKARTRSSWHLHHYRTNHFVVLSGRIAVEVNNGIDYKERDSASLRRYVLKAGQSCTVPAGSTHRFRVIEDGFMVEVYWPSRDGAEVQLADIERFDVGGEDLEWEEIHS